MEGGGWSDDNEMAFCMLSIGSADGWESGVCEGWYMGGVVGETIGTCEGSGCTGTVFGCGKHDSG